MFLPESDDASSVQVVSFEGEHLMQRKNDGTIITLLTDKLPDSAAQNYIKERKTTQVPKDKQKGKSFGGIQTTGEFLKVRVCPCFHYVCPQECECDT